MKSVFSNPNCYLLLLAIVIVSYFNIATQYSVLFHSDIAVPILQANHFDFSSDWYYWGQNRLGSLVPLLSYLVHYFCGIPTIISIGLINYLVLLSLFVVYAGFLRKDISKIALTFIVFFPWFGPLIWIAQPYSAQLLFLGLVIKTLRLITSGDLDTPKPPSMRVSLLLALSIFLSFLSVWMSDYSLVFLLYIYFDFSKKFLPKFFRLPLLKKLQVASFTTISLLSCIVVLYLFKKSAGNGQSTETIFMSSSHFKESLKVYFSRFMDILFLEGHSIDSLVAIFFIICMVYLRKAFVNFNSLFFVLLLLAIFPTIVLDWVWVNYLSGRYFTPAFFFLAFCLIQASETSINLKVSPGKLALVCFLCVLQSLPIFLFEHGQSSYKALSEFRKLGGCGIIGDYGSSYNIAAVNPDSIVASPHSGSLVRNRKLIDQIITKPAIYFVANDWLKNFPDSVFTLDHWFRRAKTPEFNIQNYTLSKYFAVPDISEFHLTHKNMTMPMGHLIRRDNKDYWLSEEDREGWVWFGPHLSLPKGNYDVYYDVNVKPLTGSKIDNPVTLDICTDGGQSVLTERAIQPSDYNSKKQFVLSLSLKETTSTLEFRIHKFNNSVVEVKDIIIRRR